MALCITNWEEPMGSVGRKQEAASEFAKAVSQMDAVTKAQVGAESL